MSFNLFIQSVPFVLQGLVLTIFLTLGGFILGQLLALPIGIAAVSSWRILAFPAKIYIFIVRGSPLLVQLFIVYYGLSEFEVVRTSIFWPILREPLYCAILTLGLNSAAYVAEIIASALQKLPYGQIKACISLGLSRRQQFMDILLPQVYRNILPSISNEMILVLKSTSLASTVTLLEMTGAARAFAAKTYAPFEVLIAAGILYLLIGIVVSLVFKQVERYFPSSLHLAHSHDKLKKNSLVN